MHTNNCKKHKYLFYFLHIASFRWALSICEYFPQGGTKCPNISCHGTMGKIKIRVAFRGNPVNTVKSFKYITNVSVETQKTYPYLWNNLQKYDRTMR